MTLNRREFVRVAGCALGGSLLVGCAGQAIQEVAPRDGALTLSLARYPQLTRAGGSLKVRPAGTDTTIYVLALEGGRVAAVSPICTHRGCTVGIEGALLVCPCHGSTYDREGRVLRGPAADPLRAFAATRSSTEIVIHLEGSRS